MKAPVSGEEIRGDEVHHYVAISLRFLQYISEEKSHLLINEAKESIVITNNGCHVIKICINNCIG